MDIADPKQAELERLIREIPGLIERLQNEYTKFFNGAEKKPPLKLRALLDKSTEQARVLLRTCQNKALMFKTQNTIARSMTYTAMWDKKLLDRERK